MDYIMTGMEGGPETDLRERLQLLDRIREAQASYIVTGDPRTTFGCLLDALVSMTGSEFGFLDEVMVDKDGSLYKLSLALSNISWNAESENLYEKLKERRLEFRNLKNLAGIPALTGQPLIANDAPHDERCGGLPHGHPCIRTFMGLPIRFADQVVGVAGVANRAGGYDEKTARFLEPFLSSCGGMIHASRQRAQAREAVDSLRENEAHLRAAQSIARMGRWELDLDTGCLTWSGGIFEQYEECRVSSPENYDDLLEHIHPDDREMVDRICRKSFAEGVDFELEHRLMMPDGGVKWVSAIGHTGSGAADGSGRFIGTIQDITHRKREEEDLKASLAEKDVLLREVHHRVKNNLASIISLLELQKEGIRDESALASLRELSNRIMSMALVHTRLYRSGNLACIGLREYLGELASHLVASYSAKGGIRCAVEADGVEMGIGLAIPVGLIINELVTNSIKHAFPKGEPGPEADGCEIMISARKDRDAYILTVADNGVGLPSGLDWRNCDSLGLSLVMMLGESQLGGEVSLDRSRGTCFNIRFSETESSRTR